MGLTLARTRNSVGLDFDPESPVTTERKSLAMSCLNEAIDKSGTQRKVLATECGRTEPQFSKQTGGAEAFPLAQLDSLPLHLVDDFFERYRKARGINRRRMLRQRAAVALLDLLAEDDTLQLPDRAGPAAKADLK